MTFQVDASRPDGTDRTRLLAQTLTTAERWERRWLDLAAYAGETLRISLSLAADADGAIGLWGSPVVRNDGARPVAAAQAPPASSAGSLGVRPRGVILIQVDTLRRDHLDVYGYERETAPVLSRLAAEGATFRRTTAQATWTKVSTPSTMTSLYPLSHGVRDFADRLPASAETLAEQYRAAGYATLACSLVPFTGQFSNMHQGFEELHESSSVDSSDTSKTAREYVDRLTEWLGTHRDVLFFVFLHVFDPHDPFEPREPYATMWADPAHKAEHEAQLDAVREHIENQILRQFGMPDRRALEAAEIDPEAYVGYDEDWLLIHNRARDDDTPEFELYDVATDPLNLTNVADAQTEVVERLARELDCWHRIAEQARLPDDAEATAGLSQEQLERLRSLGYIR